jgi:protein-tyrosine phosphatase
MYEIVPNIFLSSFRDLDIDSSWLVVNCTKDLPMKGFGLRIPVDDAPDENSKMYDAFHKVVPWIRDHQNQKIVIHCAAGQQRSAAVVAAYLLSEYHPQVQLNNVIAYMKSKKHDAFLNHETFRPALEKWITFLVSRESPSRIIE